MGGRLNENHLMYNWIVYQIIFTSKTFSSLEFDFSEK